MNLETGLKRALEREPAPAGFAERVLARTNQQRRRTMAHSWMAIAALFAAGAFVAADVHSYQARREAEARKAGRELVIALKITGSKLHATGKMIRRRVNGV